MLSEDEQLHVRIREDFLFSEDLFELHQLRLNFTMFQCPSLIDQSTDLENLVFKQGWIKTDRSVFNLLNVFFALLFGQVVQIFRNFHLLPQIFAGVFQNFFPFVAHAIKASTNSVNTGSKPSLEHGHREA